MPVPDLRGKRVVITGAASGIGLATARKAAAAGAHLILTDIQAGKLQEAVASIVAAGGTVAHAAPADLVDHDAVVAFADAAHERGGSVDVVMNVAGISTWGAVEALEHRHWRRTVDVDLMGPISVIECFVPPMIEARRGGHVVNVASAAALIGLPWHAPYSAAKFGLRGVSEVLRFDLRRHRIGVSLVCPGAVKTPLVGTVDIVGIAREHPDVAKLTKRFEGHAVTPEHVADRILDGIRRNRYLVHTSRDIQLAYWAQRMFPPGYELAMRLLNDRLIGAARNART